jgi:hypothetical protein
LRSNASSGLCDHHSCVQRELVGLVVAVATRQAVPCRFVVWRSKARSELRQKSGSCCNCGVAVHPRFRVLLLAQPPASTTLGSRLLSIF